MTATTALRREQSTPLALPLVLTLLVFAVALVPRLLIVAQPIPVQLDRTLPDDAYYYFLTAQNIAAGHGPSVDGVHASNGWHPLWMLITTAVFAPSYADPDTPVRIALALGALADSLVAVVLYRAARRYIGEAALVGGLVYAINVMPMFQAVNGLETGLAALLVALAWVVTLRFAETPTPRWALTWGALFGLCFLARTDTALILVWLGLGTLVALLRRPRALPLIGAAAVAAVVVITPWLLWNQANFGSPFEQSSSGAVPWAAAARWTAANPGASSLQHGLEVISGAQYWLRGDYLGGPAFAAFALWVLALVGLWRARNSAGRPLVGAALLLLAGGALLLLVHTFLRFYPRPWYFVVVAQSLSLGLALLWYTVGARARLAAIAVAAPLMIVSGMFMWQIGLYSWQTRLQYAGALWVRDNTPPDARIAAMNSGIIGYYSGRATTNLDGVVNPAAFDAIQQYRLLDYMIESGIDYFVDVDFAIDGEYGFFMGEGYRARLRELARIGEGYPGLGYIRAYALEPAP